MVAMERENGAKSVYIVIHFDRRRKNKKINIHIAPSGTIPVSL